MSDKFIIRSKTFKQWMLANFTIDNLRDLAEHGANTGWPYLTYYDDTVKLFEHFKEEIFDKLYDLSQDYGEDMGQLMASMMKRNNVQCYRTFANLMTWFMAEETAREVLREKFPNEW